MTLKHPEYAHGISDAELIKEAIAFCDEELDAYEGMEYDDDSEVCCQRSNTFIRELVRRLDVAPPEKKAWKIAEDALASISGERTPQLFPETSYDLAERSLREARAALTGDANA